ncbi:MAG: DUF1232 domain-containing protein [Clostridiaceae bacterium]|jgi:uncharacterized membrane protein YkvA (DUF1232 family)|nr:DUF1232 domain-containing protein [Clostridiaceae bacterium]
MKKLERLNNPQISNAFEDIKLMIELVRDYTKGEYKEVPIGSIIAIQGVVLYFLSPIDIIPDFIPVAAYIDDLTVIGLVVKQVHNDLQKYKRTRMC